MKAVETWRIKEGRRKRRYDKQERGRRRAEERCKTGGEDKMSHEKRERRREG